jgi:sugar-specific transcriptional regulator TrmB
MNELLFALIRIGIEEKLAKVYLAGLKVGSTNATNLAKISDTKRGSIYGFLKELKQLGLCSESVKGKKKIFTMSDPNYLKVLQNDRENYLNNIMPKLRQIVTIPNIPKVQVYNGIEEVKMAYEITLTSKTEIYTIESVNSTVSGIGEKYVDDYIKRRVQKKINVKLLANDEKLAKFFKEKDEEELRKTKIFPFKLNLGIDVEVWDEKVLFVSFENPAFAVLIEDRKISSSLKSIFEFIWKFII